MLHHETTRAQVRADLAASIVVFLVALPLCLGIALASGAPLFSGIVTGVVGGLVVPVVSRSPLAVSGPAAGLTAIVFAGVEAHGYEGLLVAVVLAGLIQMGLGFARAGFIAYYFPSSVIRGLLAGIGAIIILKQLPHALGIDVELMTDATMRHDADVGTLAWLRIAANHVEAGATLISGVSIALLVLWDRWSGRPRALPGPLLVVLWGVLGNGALGVWAPSWQLHGPELVTLPPIDGASLLSALPFPRFSALMAGQGWLGIDGELLRLSAVLAAVASIETLLCVEAIDKLDPYRRTTPTSRELVAQGVGNVVSGLLGGLPLTAVVVRGSANVQAGGQTRLSAMLHGTWLLVAVLALQGLLARIPLAALAAVLLHVGYKLTPVSGFRAVYRQGREAFIAFAATFVGIVWTDLLSGVAFGMAVTVVYILWRNFKTPYFIRHRTMPPSGARAPIQISLAEHVTFWHKASVVRELQSLTPGTEVVLDASQSRFIDRDVLEVVARFVEEAPRRGVTLTLAGFPQFEPVGGQGHP
jgi:MFS superfamily sulfate permease-like transporter